MQPRQEKPRDLTGHPHTPCSQQAVNDWPITREYRPTYGLPSSSELI